MSCATGFACALIFGGTGFGFNSATLALSDAAREATWSYPSPEWTSAVGAVSSVKVPSNLVVTMYTDTGCTLNAHVYTQDSPTLPRFNDKAQCVKLEHPAILFGNTDYLDRGDSKWLGRGIFNADAWEGVVGGLSSVKVAPGTTVTLYTGPNRTGDSVVLTADNPRLDGKFNDKVRSIEIK